MRHSGATQPGHLSRTFTRKPPAMIKRDPSCASAVAALSVCAYPSSELLERLKKTGNLLVLTINGKAEVIVQDAESGMPKPSSRSRTSRQRTSSTPTKLEDRFEWASMLSNCVSGLLRQEEEQSVQRNRRVDARGAPWCSRYQIAATKGRTAVVSSASLMEPSRLRAIMEIRTRGANRLHDPSWPAE